MSGLILVVIFSILQVAIVVLYFWQHKAHVMARKECEAIENAQGGEG